MTLEPLEFVPHEIMSFDDKVLVLGHEQVRARANDSVLETDWAHPFTLRAGKLARLREFYDTATIAQAFGGDRARPHQTSDIESRRT